MTTTRDYALEIRLAFIDHCFVEKAGVTRGDLVAAFGVSTATAARDVQAFRVQHPARGCSYDSFAKIYRPRHGSTPAYSRSERAVAWSVAATFGRAAETMTLEAS